MKHALQQSKDRVDAVVLAETTSVLERRAGFESAKKLGALAAIGNLGRVLNAQAFRAIEAFIDGEDFKHLGFQTAAEFLGSPDSPLTRNQYYDRKALIDAEGDDVYDLMNSMRIPARTRKLLGDGKVRIEAGDVIVDSERIPLSDTKRAQVVIEELAKTIAKKDAVISRGEEQVKKLRDDVRKAREESARADTSNPSQDPHTQAVNHLLAAFAKLTLEARKLTGEERIDNGVAIRTCDLISNSWEILQTAYGLLGDIPGLSDDDGGDDLD